MRRIRFTSSAPFVYIRRKKRRKVSTIRGKLRKNLYRRKNLRYLNTKSRAPPNGGSPVRRLSAHRNGLPHRQDAGLPRGGHDPGDGARDAAERPMDKLHRAASLSAWKKAPLPKKAAVLAFLRYVNYNETDH
jgi:hypothetical protein